MAAVPAPDPGKAVGENPPGWHRDQEQRRYPGGSPNPSGAGSPRHSGRGFRRITEAKPR
jgi:hypothetical protein